MVGGSAESAECREAGDVFCLASRPNKSLYAFSLLVRRRKRIPRARKAKEHKIEEHGRGVRSERLILNLNVDTKKNTAVLSRGEVHSQSRFPFLFSFSRVWRLLTSHFCPVRLMAPSTSSSDDVLAALKMSSAPSE